MARAGHTDLVFNRLYFDRVLLTAPVTALTDAVGERALAKAKATAPVDSGDYRDHLHIEHYDASHRRTTRVVGNDAKTLLIEAQTGNLARTLKAAKQ